MKRFVNILAVSLIRLLSLTWRISLAGEMPSEPSVLAFWHGLMLPVWKYFSKVKPAAIVSRSKDGQLLSDLLERWNYTVVRGSSSQGGKDALDSIVGLLDERLVLITPDGPRGPACKFKAGAAVASLKTGAPVYLCSVHIKKSKILGKSWDSFHVPLPFTRIELTLSPPIVVPGGSSREETAQYILLMETTLNDMQKENE